MIRLFDNWCLDADDYSYTLFKSCTDGKGRLLRVDATYYSTLRSALLQAPEKLIRARVKEDKITTLKELVEQYEAITKLLEDKIDGKLK